MRHVPGPTREEPGEAEWIIAAAGNVTNPVFAEKRLTHVTAKEAWTFPCSKAESFKASKIVIEFYVRAAEKKSSPQLPHPMRTMRKNCCAWSASAETRYLRRNDE
jgi:hypothetical protein